jgi:hypothetical protein
VVDLLVEYFLFQLSILLMVMYPDYFELFHLLIHLVALL